MRVFPLNILILCFPQKLILICFYAFFSFTTTPTLRRMLPGSLLNFIGQIPKSKHTDYHRRADTCGGEPEGEQHRQLRPQRGRKSPGLRHCRAQHSHGGR